MRIKQVRRQSVTFLYIKTAHSLQWRNPRKSAETGEKQANDKPAAVIDTYVVPPLIMFLYLATGCQLLCYALYEIFLLLRNFLVRFGSIEGNKQLPFSKENTSGKRRASM